ncbi:MAG: hypothetical protein ABIZ50_04780, partial [Solirubrobacterales bacterium]
MIRNLMRMALLSGVTLAALALPSTAATAATNSFSNPGTIVINDNSAATPYPSNVAVAGQCGTVTDANVTLTNLSYNGGPALDVLLVSPSGNKTLLLSDLGAGAVSGVTLTFDDAAAAPIPPMTPITSGTYKPSDFESATPSDVFPSPAPAGPYGAPSLAVFNGTAPNGTWQLFVMDDDGFGDVGSFAGGWTLTLATADCPPPPPPPPTPTPDTNVDGVFVKVKNPQKVRGDVAFVKIKAGAAERVKIVAGGSIALGKKKIVLKKQTKTSPDTNRIRFKLKPKKKADNAKIFNALSKGKGKSLKTSLKVKLTDDAGNSVTKKPKTKLIGART